MNCLFCYQNISDEESLSPAGQKQFHTACSKKMFGKPVPPEVPFTEENLRELADRVIKVNKTVPGVQPKLSLGLDSDRNSGSERFTIVGLMGEFILKPQTEIYPHLPELEDLTMHLAAISKISTVPHTLMRLSSGQLVYVTKRVDRFKGGKLHMEDMCQLTERLTEHKYRGSYEQVAKVILKYSANPVLDVVNFYEQVVFCFLTGNNDMHLKNFSLLKRQVVGYNLSPAYDMVAAMLVVEGDNEELALNLNGKKRKLKRNDFEQSMLGAGLPKKTVENIFRKFHKTHPKWEPFIEQSFLSKEMQLAYLELVRNRTKILELE